MNPGRTLAAVALLLIAAGQAGPGFRIDYLALAEMDEGACRDDGCSSVGHELALGPTWSFGTSDYSLALTAGKSLRLGPDRELSDDRQWSPPRRQRYYHYAAEILAAKTFGRLRLEAGVGKELAWLREDVDRDGDGRWEFEGDRFLWGGDYGLVWGIGNRAGNLAWGIQGFGLQRIGLRLGYSMGF